jgi:hypothetical protein
MIWVRFSGVMGSRKMGGLRGRVTFVRLSLME